MEGKEIIDGNVLIAEFMEKKWYATRIGSTDSYKAYSNKPYNSYLECRAACEAINSCNEKTHMLLKEEKCGAAILYTNKYEPQFDTIELKYHSSWDWLMPVLEKIEKIGYTTIIEFDDAADKTNSCFIGTEKRGEFSTSYDEISEVYKESKIEATFIAVIEFIRAQAKIKI